MKRPWIQNQTSQQLEMVCDTRSYFIGPKEKLYYDSAYPEVPRDQARFLCERMHARYHRVQVEKDRAEAWVTTGYD